MIVRICLLIVAVGIPDCRADPRPSPYYPQDRIIVATGHWEGNPDYGREGAACYKIDEVIRRTFTNSTAQPLTNETVILHYSRSTVSRSFPAKAILLMTPLKNQVEWEGHFSVLAEDASVGIIPDTPANRDRLAKLSDSELRDSPEDRWLPMERAETVARAEAVRTGVDLSRATSTMLRTHYGWLMTIRWHDKKDRQWTSWYEIGDSGRIRSSRKSSGYEAKAGPRISPPNTSLEPL